jgi:hypothetical protein
MSTLDSLITEADALEALAGQFAEQFASRAEALRAQIRAYKASLGKAADVQYVKSDGRLTEAGVRYCNEAFKQGRGPSEIARALGVTVPAIVMRRQRWQAARKRRKGQ